MKAFRRNAVILTVLLFVCVAVYLNWSYGKKEEAAALAGAEAEETAEASADESAAPEEAGLFYTGGSAETQTEAGISQAASAYFDTVRLSREQARSAARETLLTVTAADGAAQTTVDEALSSISRMAEWTVLESTLEGEIMAKGYEECVVFITQDGVTVTVPAPSEGLSRAAVARITDVVLDGTEFVASQLRIVEVK